MVIAEVGGVLHDELQRRRIRTNARHAIRKIELPLIGDLQRLVSDIAGLKNDARSDLALIIQSPLRVVWIWRLRIESRIAARHGLARDQLGHRGVVDRVLQAELGDVVAGKYRAERNIKTGVNVSLEIDDRKRRDKKSYSSAHHVLAAAIHIPRKADARRNVVVIGVVSGVGRAQSGRHHYGRQDSVRIKETAVAFFIHGHVFVSYADIQDQIRPHAEIILGEKSQLPFPALERRGPKCHLYANRSIRQKISNVRIRDFGRFLVPSPWRAPQEDASKLHRVPALYLTEDFFETPDVPALPKALARVTEKSANSSARNLAVGPDPVQPFDI